jgi:hypothetical protein
MNAVGVGDGKLDFLINGNPVRPQGYELGDVTGGIPRAPTSYRFSFRRNGVEPGETTVDIVKNETTTLIPFAEFVPATDKKEAHWIIRILRLKQSDSREKAAATLVNLTRQPELKVHVRVADESWVTLHVPRLHIARTPLEQRTGYIDLKTDDMALDPLSIASTGNYVAVIYENSKGEVRSQNFHDLKYLSME